MNPRVFGRGRIEVTVTITVCVDVTQTRYKGIVLEEFTVTLSVLVVFFVFVKVIVARAFVDHLTKNRADKAIVALFFAIGHRARNRPRAAQSVGEPGLLVIDGSEPGIAEVDDLYGANGG